MQYILLHHSQGQPILLQASLPLRSKKEGRRRPVRCQDGDLWCPRVQSEAISLCRLIYFNPWGCLQDGSTRIHFPPTDLRPLSCLSVKRIHSSPHESDWPWPKEKSGPFLTPLHTHVCSSQIWVCWEESEYWRCLWHLGTSDWAVQWS